MITSQFVLNEIATDGKVMVNDLYQNHCCTDFDWEVVLIFHDHNNSGYNSIWGTCDNPDCHVEKDNEQYHGVSNILQEDFEECLAQRSGQGKVN